MLFEPADRIMLPPFPTREEVAEFCNQGLERRHPVTPDMVRGWERRRLIRPHKAFRKPTRYDCREIAAFLNGMFGRFNN